MDLGYCIRSRFIFEKSRDQEEISYWVSLVIIGEIHCVVRIFSCIYYVV